MNIFLTGGTGSIGSAVLAQTAAAGHHVTALARSDAAGVALSAAGATPLSGDITKPDSWMPQAVAADVFIHLASSFDDTMTVTEPALLNSLITHAQARATSLRFLYTGGCWLYGQTGSAVATETSPMRPIQAFKWSAKAIAMVQDHPDLSCAILHPAMVYDETGGVFRRMMAALRAGRPASIWGSESTRWPLVHREDAACAYLLLAQNDAVGLFNIVAEHGVAVGDIADTLSKQAGNKTKPAVLPPKWVLSQHGHWAEGPMLDQQMRSTRMAALGWSPQHADYTALTYAF
jgi:nucleoside-diphosphate-sugar epimerase